MNPALYVFIATSTHGASLDAVRQWASRHGLHPHSQAKACARAVDRGVLAQTPDRPTARALHGVVYYVPQPWQKERAG